jgi:hypothetical protein
MGSIPGPPPENQVSVETVGNGPAIVGKTIASSSVPDSATGHLAGSAAPDADEPLGFAGVIGAFGTSTVGVGVLGTSHGHDGVHGRSHDSRHSGVAGINAGGGIGVFGTGAPAGFFLGDLIVEGNAKISGTINGDHLGNLEARISQLEALISQLGRTNAGVPNPPASSRPFLTVKSQTSTGPGPQTIILEGHGFLPGKPITLQIIHSSGVVDTIPGRDPSTLFFNAPNGDNLTVTGTDNRPDANDDTRLLWSTMLHIPVG